jgi:hypothetical protein
MRRPVKLDFTPLSLEDTAKALGIPQKRAAKIIAMFGLAPEGLRMRRRTKSKAGARKAFSRSAKASR